MASSDLSNLSAESPALRGLTEAQQDRLTTLLERYLVGLEQGEPITLEALIEQNPDLADSLRAYTTSLEDLHGIAAGFNNQPQAEPDSASLSEPAHHDERRLGDFRLIREVGRGGMGVVYEAQQISLNRRVALKVLPFAAVLDSRQIARFKTEAQAAAQVLHPNIVPVFAIGVERGVHYYAMQFVDGRPLDKAIEELRRCPASAGKTGRDREDWNTVIRLGMQAAEALHAAHEYGIVHRDVKPSNLLLDGEGKVWVTDFGLARVQTSGSLTQTGDVVGTRRYMSPEQAAGQSALVDQRTDIYSLGVTLYELLALQPAFADPGSGAPSRRLPDETPRPLRHLQPSIPVDLETVIMKSMVSSRDERYATAQAFADDLRRVLEGRPTVARPPSLTERLGKWGRRHQRLVAAGGAIALVAICGLTLGIVLVNSEKGKTQESLVLAERRMRDAHEVVHEFAKFAERLADVPGAAQVRQQALKDTLAYYQRFVAEAEHDPALRSELAETFNKMATVAEELGSPSEALAAHQSARDLFAKLADDEPGEPKYQRRLAQCENNLGLALTRTGQTSEAEESFKRAIERQEAFVLRDEAAYAEDLALTQSNLGLLFAETNRPGEAKQAFQTAVSLRERQLARDPNDGELNRNLAGALNNLASLYLEQAPVEAISCYERALACRRSAVALKPDDMRELSELALAWNNLGAQQARLNQLEAAAESYDQAIEIQTDLVRRGPLQKSFRRDLAVSFNNRGLAQSQGRDPSGAEASFQLALELLTKVAAEHPEDLALQSNLGGVYNNLGSVLESLGRIEPAAEAYQHAIRHQETAFQSAPEISRYRNFLSRHYFNCGRALRALARPGGAVEVALKRKTLWQRAPEKLYSVAEELALASGQLPESDPAGMTSAKCAELAVDTLKEAVSAGLVLPQDVTENRSFAFLRDNARFVELVKR